VNATGVAGVQWRIFYDGTDHPLWMYDNINDLTVYFELDTAHPGVTGGPDRSGGRPGKDDDTCQ